MCVCVCVRARAILCACVFAMFCMTMLILVCFVPLYTTDLYNYGYLCIVCFSLNCKALWDSESALYVPHYYYYVHPFNSQNTTTTNPLLKSPQYWDLTSKSLNENICEHLWNFQFHLTSWHGQIVQKLLQCDCPWTIRLLGLCTSQVSLTVTLICLWLVRVKTMLIFALGRGGCWLFHLGARSVSNQPLRHMQFARSIRGFVFSTVLGELFWYEKTALSSCLLLLSSFRCHSPSFLALKTSLKISVWNSILTSNI